MCSGHLRIKIPPLGRRKEQAPLLGRRGIDRAVLAPAAATALQTSDEKLAVRCSVNFVRMTPKCSRFRALPRMTATIHNGP